MASEIVDEATEGPKPEAEDTRDPAAVELGRKGGLKGGKVRARKLSASDERRSVGRPLRAGGADLSRGTSPQAHDRKIGHHR